MGAAFAATQTCGCGTGCQKRGGDITDGLWNVVAMRYPAVEAPSVSATAPQPRAVPYLADPPPDKTYAWAAFQSQNDTRASSVAMSNVSSGGGSPAIDLEKAAPEAGAGRGSAVVPLEVAAQPLDGGASPTPPRVPWRASGRTPTDGSELREPVPALSLCKASASKVHCSTDFATQEDERLTEVCLGPPESGRTVPSDTTGPSGGKSSVLAMVDVDMAYASPPQSPLAVAGHPYASPFAQFVDESEELQDCFLDLEKERALAANLQAEVAKLRRELGNHVTARDVDVGGAELPVSAVSSLSSTGTARRLCCCCRRRR